MKSNSKWPVINLSDVCEINPRRPASLLKLPNDYPVTFVPMPAVEQFGGTICSPETRPFGEVRKGFTYFGEGDVIFAKITPCMQNGKSAIARDLVNQLGFGSTEFHVIRPNSDKILAEWVWHFVRQGPYRQEATHHFQGAVGQQRVPASYLEKTLIPLPPVPEQRRVLDCIRECLDRVLEIEGLRGESKKESDSLGASVFADYVESLTNKECRAASLGDILTDCKYGSSTKASRDNKGTPILRMGNIQDGRLDVHDLKYIKLPKHEIENYLLNEGDILINRTNSLELVGKSALFEKLEGDWIYASYLIRLRIDLSLALPEYVNAVINSRIGRGYVLRTARRAIGMVNINAKEIAKMPIPLPSLEAQQEIVNYMKEAEPLIISLEEEFTDVSIAHLRDSILRKAFAGEL